MDNLERVFEGFPIPSNPCIISYDVDSIKSYIFAPDEFQKIIGGSVLIRQFDEEIAENLKDLAVRIFSGGGSGMFLVSKQNCERTKETIVETFKNKVPGASITVVSEELSKIKEFFGCSSQNRTALVSDFKIPTEPTFYGVFSYMASKMGREKRNKVRTSEVLVNANQEPCEICGVGKPENGRVCRACIEKGNAVENLKFGSGKGLFESLWKTMSLNLNEIATKSSEGQRGWLGVIYGDGNNLGKIYKQINIASEYAKFSENLEKAILKAVENVAKQWHLYKKFAAPILGGDDLMLLVPADRVFNVLESLISELSTDEFLKSKDITFSFGVAVVPSTLPVRFIFELAQKLLKSAKESSYANQRKGFHVAYRFLEMGVFKPKTLFKVGERIYSNLGCGMKYDEFKKLLNEVVSLKNARKRNLLYKLLSVLETEPAEAIINAYYFCARDDYFKGRKIREFVDEWVLSKKNGKFLTRIPEMLEMWDFVGEG